MGRNESRGKGGSEGNVHPPHLKESGPSGWLHLSHSSLLTGTCDVGVFFIIIIILFTAEETEAMRHSVTCHIHTVTKGQRQTALRQWAPLLWTAM